jgi:hypothetical protein
MDRQFSSRREHLAAPPMKYHFEHGRIEFPLHPKLFFRTVTFPSQAAKRPKRQTPELDA